MKIKTTPLLLLAAVSLSLLTGCGAVISTNQVYRNDFSENIPTPDLSPYKSVQAREGQDESLAVGMAISGGGTRAANFAMGTLLALEEIKTPKGNALREIDYFSTVSGGGFAAGAYLSSIYNFWFRIGNDPAYRDANPTYSLRDAYDRKIKKDLNRSYVDPMLRSYFFSMRAWFTFIDEGDALERAIDNHVLGYRVRRKIDKESVSSISLGDMFIRKEETRPVTYPIMVPNGTIYASMAIFPFTPDILSTYQVSGYTHRMKPFFKDKEMPPGELPLSVGIKASGSFPVLISNTTLMSAQDSVYKYLHIIDGGVADNIGYKTAIEMLNQDEIATKKILFVVDADGGGFVPTFSKKKGGAFSLKVYSKLATSGLDSRHIVLRKELTQACKLNNITPVFLSFATLIEGNSTVPPAKIRRRKETRRLIDLFANSPEMVTELDRQILYELARNVGTKYTIEKREQQLLTLAGREVIKTQMDQILKALD